MYDNVPRSPIREESGQSSGRHDSQVWLRVRPGKYRTSRTGNHGQMISARRAPLIGNLRSHGRLRPVYQASLSGYGPGCSGRGHRSASENTDALDCAATGPRRPTAVLAHRCADGHGHDHHTVGHPASAAGHPSGMADLAAAPQVNSTSLVCRSFSCFDGTGLSLGDLGMRSRISPMFESCLPPSNASSCIAGWDLRPTEQCLAWCGPQ
jgi:hypothetical protein